MTRITLFYLVALWGINSAFAQNLIWTSKIQELPEGVLSKEQIKDHFETRYVKGSLIDEGQRISVVANPMNFDTGDKALRIKYPNESIGTSNSGATWETDIGIHTDELYLSYWVKFDDDFDFRHGGKLPGLRGTFSPFPGNEPFRIRLMWREDGKVEFYLHDYGMPNALGETPYRHWWDKGGQRHFIPGTWHHIEIQVKLNTPGLLDGELRGWFDGELAFEDTNSNVGVRAIGQEDRKLNCFFFNTFFGGSSAQTVDGVEIPGHIYWGPIREVYANFADIQVSTNRIGMEEETVGVSRRMEPLAAKLRLNRVQDGFALHFGQEDFQVDVLNLKGNLLGSHKGKGGFLALRTSDLADGINILRIKGSSMVKIVNFSLD